MLFAFILLWGYFMFTVYNVLDTTKGCSFSFLFRSISYWTTFDEAQISHFSSAMFLGILRGNL